MTSWNYTVIISHHDKNRDLWSREYRPELIGPYPQRLCEYPVSEVSSKGLRSVREPVTKIVLGQTNPSKDRSTLGVSEMGHQVSGDDTAIKAASSQYAREMAVRRFVAVKITGEKDSHRHTGVASCLKRRAVT